MSWMLKLFIPVTLAVAVAVTLLVQENKLKSGLDFVTFKIFQKYDATMAKITSKSNNWAPNLSKF